MYLYLKAIWLDY